MLISSRNIPFTANGSEACAVPFGPHSRSGLVMQAGVPLYCCQAGYLQRERRAGVSGNLIEGGNSRNGESAVLLATLAILRDVP